MPFVTRKDGQINGCFGSPQPGFAAEHLDESDAEVVAFRNRGSMTKQDEVEASITRDQTLMAIVRRSAKSEGKTEREILDEIRAEVK